ncbi:DUF2384 domain-containing protein [bacterium]|nr:DUF2384 domain-containing protein [bacterium]
MRTLEKLENCPCGSGQLPALCCLGDDQALRLEGKFCERLRQYALRTRGPKWLEQARKDLKLESDDQELFDGLFAKLAYFHYGHPTLFDSFLGQRPGFSAEETTLVWALQHARLSVFKILEIRRGQSILVQDLLFGGYDWVHEGSLAEPDMRGAVLLARLAPVGPATMMFGMYIRPMAEWKARLILDQLEGQAGQRLEPALLRQWQWSSQLCALWRQGFRELDEFSMPLQVTSEGEPIVRVRDCFPFEQGQGETIRQALKGFPELYWDNRQSARWFVGPSELGRVSLQPKALILECDSLGRAERLGEGLRTIPALQKRRRQRTRPLKDESIRKIYQEWSSRWPEEALAALGGLTPRQSVDTAEGRQRVTQLLGEFESYQRTLPSTQSISIEPLRSELGL